MSKTLFVSRGPISSFSEVLFTAKLPDSLLKEGKNISEAKAGDRVAVSMEEPTIGRQVREGDILTVVLSDEDKKTLRGLGDKLGEGEKELLEEI